jgi:hypothetical protein
MRFGLDFNGAVVADLMRREAQGYSRRMQAGQMP